MNRYKRGKCQEFLGFLDELVERLFVLLDSFARCYVKRCPCLVFTPSCLRRLACLANPLFIFVVLFTVAEISLLWIYSLNNTIDIHTHTTLPNSASGPPRWASLANSPIVGPPEYPWNVHETSRLSLKKYAQAELTYRAIRSMTESTPCPPLINIDLPLDRSFSRDVLGARQDHRIQQLVRLRKTKLATLRSDLETMCELHKKRIRKLKLIQEAFQSRGKGTEENPLKIYAGQLPMGWSSERGITNSADRAFHECQAVGEFVFDSTKADVFLGWEYCDFRMQNPPRMPINSVDHVFAMISLETIYPSKGDADYRRSAQMCWNSIDVLVTYDRFSELEIFYADLHTYTTVLREGQPFLPEELFLLGSEFKEEMNELTISRRHSSRMIAAFLSNCGSWWSTRSDYRNQYADSLGRYIPVDVYGFCGTLRTPEQLDPPYDVLSEGLQKRVSKCLQTKKYKFVLAFENAMREGYVTEKLWEALWCPYSIPVYLGAPDVRRFFDQDQWMKYKYFINANEFPDPRDLALYLDYLSTHEEEYMKYFLWRVDGAIPKAMMKPPIRAWHNTEGENIALACRLVELLTGKNSTTNLDINDEYLFIKGYRGTSGLDQTTGRYFDE